MMRTLVFVLMLCLCSVAQALGIEVEAGASRSQSTPTGVWYQKGVGPYSLRLTSPTWSAGVRLGNASIGYVDLLNVSTHAKATVRDEDYDVAGRRCRDHCDALADFSTSGRVRGLYARYQWDLWRGAFIEPGLLVFIPTTRIEVRDWREGGLLSNPAVSATYDHRPRVQVAPSVGVGYQDGHVGGVLRLYAAVKTLGKSPLPQGGEWQVVSPYAGLVVTATVRVVF